MNDPAFLAALGAAVVFLAAAVFAFTRASSLSRRLAVAEERVRQSGENAEILKVQAAQSAQVVADELVKRASETFRSQEALALERMAGQLKPVADTLAKFELQVAAIEKARAEDTGGIKQQIAEMLRATADTQFEARKLSAALRRGAGVQGRWGEQTLRNVLEAAGLQHRFDFDEQVTTDDGEGRRRPDVIVRLPGGGVLVIDAKCSLNAFLEAQDAPDDVSREAFLVRHAASVREHMRGLASRGYAQQFERSPDIVAMFVPGDSFLAAALERLPDLLSDAMAQKVVLVTPTTLFALCKAVSYGWRIEDQAKSAEQVAALGRELYKRLSVMGGHIAGLGKSLEGAVTRYNAFVGSMESQVLSQARRFEELAVDHEGRDLPELSPVDTLPRSLAKLAAEETAPGEAPVLTLRGR